MATQQNNFRKYYVPKKMYDHVRSRFMRIKVEHKFSSEGGIDRLLFNDGISVNIPPLKYQGSTMISVNCNSRSLPEYIDSVVRCLKKVQQFYL